jgi:hypothetical protein
LYPRSIAATIMYRFMSGVITSSARGLVGVDEEAFFLGEVLVRFGVGLVSSDVAGEGGEPSSEGIGDDGASRLTTMMNNLLSRSQRSSDGSRCNSGTSGKRHLVSTSQSLYIFLSPDARASVAICFFTPFSRHCQSRLFGVLTTKEGLQ